MKRRQVPLVVAAVQESQPTVVRTLHFITYHVLPEIIFRQLHL